MNENRPNPPMPGNTVTEDMNKRNKLNSIIWVIAIVLILQIIISFFMGWYLFKRGYENSKTNTVSSIRKGAYETVYNYAEDEYHLSNRITVSIEGIQEKADLEVLAIDTYYLYKSDEEDNDRGLRLLYKIPGTGTYTVDLRMTEFVVDNERHHVLVKAPAPAITQFRANYAEVEKMEYRKDGWYNGSIKEGEEIARKMLARAHSQMMKSFEMTQAYHQAAKEAAKKLLTAIIRGLNPDVSDLTVDFMFADDFVS